MLRRTFHTTKLVGQQLARLNNCKICWAATYWEWKVRVLNNMEKCVACWSARASTASHLASFIHATLCAPLFHNISPGILIFLLFSPQLSGSHRCCHIHDICFFSMPSWRRIIYEKGEHQIVDELALARRRTIKIGTRKSKHPDKTRTWSERRTASSCHHQATRTRHQHSQTRWARGKVNSGWKRRSACRKRLCIVFHLLQMLWFIQWINFNIGSFTSIVIVYVWTSQQFSDWIRSRSTSSYTIESNVNSEMQKCKIAYFTIT